MTNRACCLPCVLFDLLVRLALVRLVLFWLGCVFRLALCWFLSCVGLLCCDGLPCRALPCLALFGIASFGTGSIYSVSTVRYWYWCRWWAVLIRVVLLSSAASGDAGTGMCW